jgi:hypothetical protein
MRLVLSFLLLIAASVGCAAQTPKIEILQAGIIDLGKVLSENAAPGTTSGSVNKVQDYKFIETTTTIPAKIGISFGFKHRVVGQPTGKKVDLRVVDRFPPPGIRNTSTNQMQQSDEYVVTKSLGQTTATASTFDDDGDLVPGVWTIEIWYKDQKLAEQRFTVVKQ